MPVFPGRAAGVAVSRTYKGFLQINKEKKPYRRTMDTNVGFPDTDAQMAKAYK